MSDLSELRDSGTARSEGLVQRLARRGAPTRGFVAYGVLYGVIVVNTVVLASTAAMVLVLGRVVGAPWPVWAQLLTIASLAGMGVVAWLPFAAWVRRRRAELRLLVRDGTLVDGKVIEARSFRVRGAPVTTGTIEVVIDGAPHRFALSFGGQLDGFRDIAQPVLYLPAARFGLAFPLDGAALPIRRR